MSSDVSDLLVEVRNGEPEAADRLLTLIYDDLRALAARFMGAERPGHTLQPTALVHEAYLRLVGANVNWRGRAHFIGFAARAMRQILINHAIARGAQKRGAGRTSVSLDDAVIAYESRSIDLLALDEALKTLAEIDPRQCQIVEYRFFGGMTMPEIADLTGRDLSEIQQDWRFARAWLRSRLQCGLALQPEMNEP